MPFIDDSGRRISPAPKPKPSKPQALGRPVPKDAFKTPRDLRGWGGMGTRDRSKSFDPFDTQSKGYEPPTMRAHPHPGLLERDWGRVLREYARRDMGLPNDKPPLKPRTRKPVPMPEGRQVRPLKKGESMSLEEFIRRITALQKYNRI